MSAPTRTTPRTVRLSVWLYSRLLVAYPQPFRQEYGGQMSQVFRDCCREAAATNGNIGLTHYWLIAFGDLVVSALAERRQEELHMTRTLWIRLGSLAAIIGSIGPVVLFMLSLTILLVNLLAPQAPLSLDLPVGVGWVITSQWVLSVLVLVALWIHCANRTGVFGWVGIAFAMAGAIIRGVGDVLFMSAMFYDGSQLYLYSNIIQIGSAILAVGMIFYGVIIHRHHLLPRLNWLPLAVGLTELLSVVASFSDADPLKFAILVYATSLVATTAWILLGIALWPRGDEEVPAQNVSTPVEPAI